MKAHKTYHQLDEKCKKLQEENKKLKEENKEINRKCDILLDSTLSRDGLEMVIEQLKQEKQELVEALTDLVEKWLTDNGDIYFEKAEELINKYK